MEQRVVCIKNIPDFANVNFGYSDKAVELSIVNEVNLAKGNANFKINKIYTALYEKNTVCITDDFGIDWKFDIKWQTSIQKFFNLKWRNMLFYEHFVTLEEMRKNKLNKINND